MKLVALFTTTLEMTDSSEAIGRVGLGLAADDVLLDRAGVERGAVGELQSGPERKVTVLPLAAYFHELASPACTVPLGSRVVIEA